MDVTPTAAESPIKHDDPGPANLAQEDSRVKPNNARQRNTLQHCLSVWHTGGKDVNLPGTCNRHPKSTR